MTDAASQRPRLLVLSSTFPRWLDDSEPAFVFELARRLSHRLDITVLAPHAPGSRTQEVMDGLRVIRYRYAPARWEQLATHGGGILNRVKANPLNALLIPALLIAQSWALVRLVRREPFKVIHAHWIIPQAALARAVIALTGRRIALVCTSHGGDLYGLRGKVLESIMGRVMQQADHVTVVSRAMRQRALSLGAESGKTSVLPMGVDLTTRFSPDPTHRRASNQLLFVGRLVEKKGLVVLLDALPGVISQHPDTKLLIAGDGPLRKALEQHTHRLSITRYVTFLGMQQQQQLPALYRQSVLLVAPFVVASGGDQEGLGLVLVEAMGCGCPVIAAELPAVLDVIQPGKTGMLVPSGHPEALAAQINALLSNPDKRAELASAARADVLTRFDWSMIAARYGDLLGRAADEKVH